MKWQDFGAGVGLKPVSSPRPHRERVSSWFWLGGLRDFKGSERLMVALCLALAFASVNNPPISDVDLNTGCGVEGGIEQSMSNLSPNTIVVHCVHQSSGVEVKVEACCQIRKFQHFGTDLRRFRVLSHPSSSRPSTICGFSVCLF